MTTSADTEAVVCALGIPLGRIAVGDPQALGGGVVCARGELVELSADLYTVWVGALLARPVPELAAWARDQGVDEAAALVQELASETLLDELPPAEGEWDPWLERHRLIPQGVGLGNAGEDPAEFLVAEARGNPLVAVNLATYCVWAVSASAPNLSAALAAVVSASDIPERTVRTQVRQQFPWLLGARAAYLNRA